MPRAQAAAERAAVPRQPHERRHAKGAGRRLRARGPLQDVGHEGPGQQDQPARVRGRFAARLAGAPHATHATRQPTRSAAAWHFLAPATAAAKARWVARIGVCRCLPRTALCSLRPPKSAIREQREEWDFATAAAKKYRWRGFGTCKRSRQKSALLPPGRARGKVEKTVDAFAKEMANGTWRGKWHSWPSQRWRISAPAHGAAYLGKRHFYAAPLEKWRKVAFARTALLRSCTRLRSKSGVCANGTFTRLRFKNLEKCRSPIVRGYARRCQSFNELSRSSAFGTCTRSWQNLAATLFGVWPRRCQS